METIAITITSNSLSPKNSESKEPMIEVIDGILKRESIFQIDAMPGWCLWCPPALRFYVL